MRIKYLLGTVFVYVCSYTNVAFSAPIVYDTSYSIELLTSVSGTAINALTIGSDGALYATGYNTGTVLRVDSPSASGLQSATVFSSGMPYATGITVTDNGKMFVTSSTGSNSSVYEIQSNGSATVFSSGYSYPTSITSIGNELYVSNSGDGTISQVNSVTGSNATIISGLSSPNGTYGLSSNGVDMLYFTEHATGNIFSSNLSGDLSLLGSLTPFGVGYTGINANGDLFVSDILKNEIYKIDGLGNMSLFASGFAGKNNPPFNGPHDFAFDDSGNMYVSDASSIWRISAVPVPASVWLFGSGLIGLIGLARRKVYS